LLRLEKSCEQILVPDQSQWRAMCGKSPFATKAELQRYHHSLSSALGESSQAIRDAVEFTRLAAKRCAIILKLAKPLKVLQGFAGVRRNKRCEVAFI